MSETTEVKETPKRAKVKEPSVKDLALLAKEFNTGKMPLKKLVALRVKLIGLFLERKAVKEEQELMEAILRKERNLSTINSRDSYILNKIEAERCEDVCVVKTDDAPTVHHLFKDLECKFKYDPDYNDGKGKKDSVGRFHVYVPRTVPTRHQLKNSVVERELLGHPTDPEDYPSPRVLIHRLVLKAGEFHKWFEVEEEGILEAAHVEPEYQF